MSFKRILPVLAIVALAAQPSRAFNPYDTFKAEAGAQGAQAATSLKGFSRDLGGLIGSTDFHGASIPGIPGFDVGLSAAVQLHPDNDDGVLKKAGVDKFGIPMVRAEAGLPFGFSVFLRGLPIQGATLIGGGARYQIYKSGLIFAIPNVAATFGADKISQNAFDMTHIGGSVQASWDLPIIHPFIGVGLDSSKLTAKDANVVAALNASGAGTQFTGGGTRATVGVSLTVIPFTYVFGAVNMLHGQTAGELGLGIKFGGIL